MHILEQEDREFKEAMRRAGRYYLFSTNGSNKMGSFKNVYQEQYCHSVSNWKEVEIQTMSASKQH